MSLFASRARLLADRLFAVSVRIQAIRGLVLVDASGLVLVSTLGSAGLEERLAALAGAMSSQMERARDEFQMGPLHHAHLAGRDRQIFLVPVHRDALLLAIVEADASAAMISTHLLATARELLELATAEDEPGAQGEA